MKALAYNHFIPLIARGLTFGERGGNEFTTYAGKTSQSVPSILLPFQTEGCFLLQQIDIFYFLNLLIVYIQNDNVPIIEPINVRQFEFNQSKYEHADKLPFRSIVVSARR